MKKLPTILVTAIIVIILVVFVPRLVHECDDCGDTFFGTGYEANIITEALNDEEQIICEDCAEVQHALSIIAGKSLDDFKRKLFD